MYNSIKSLRKFNTKTVSYKEKDSIIKIFVRTFLQKDLVKYGKI